VKLSRFLPALLGLYGACSQQSASEAWLASARSMPVEIYQCSCPLFFLQNKLAWRHIHRYLCLPELAHGPHAHSGTTPFTGGSCSDDSGQKSMVEAFTAPDYCNEITHLKDVCSSSCHGRVDRCSQSGGYSLLPCVHCGCQDIQ
jgi:hypothetical protein